MKLNIYLIALLTLVNIDCKSQSFNESITTFEINQSFTLDSISKKFPMNQPVFLFICHYGNGLPKERYLNVINDRCEKFKSKRPDRDFKVFVAFFNYGIYKSSPISLIRCNQTSKYNHVSEFINCLVFNNSSIDSMKIVHAFKRDVYKLDYFDKYDNSWFNVKISGNCPDDQASQIPNYFDFLEELYYPKFSTDELLILLNKQIEKNQKILLDKILFLEGKIDALQDQINNINYRK